MEAPVIKPFDFQAPNRGKHSLPAELYHTPRWYACRTRARAERQVDRLLRGWRIESYLPLMEQRRRWADRWKQVAFPLFPGYVFARFRLRDIHEVLRTPGVVTVVRTNGYPAPVREEELASVRILVEGARRTGVLPTPADFLEVGDPVVVVEGPFQGMEGVLVEVRGGFRIAVRLSAIRQAASIEMDRRNVRPLRR